jgi:NAD(P)-dependent dehydrogenase (short-subunit alcohol dehydrogenase family)
MLLDTPVGGGDPTARREGLVLSLKGRTAVITGAGRGLGLAYARALAKAGAAVLVNDVDEQAVRTVVSELTDSGASGGGAVAQIGEAEAADLLVSRAVAEFGRLDILVSNAGILRDRVLWKMSDAEFDAVIRVHLRGTFTCARAAAVHMRERGEGGRIILAGSPAGQRGNFGQTNYAAAKAGMAAMARTWAMELSRSAITVNAVIPNAATQMTRTIPALAPFAEALERGDPVPSVVRRSVGFGSAADAAGLVVFLASEAAADITGQCIGIGGDRLSLWSHPQEVSVAFTDGGWTAEAIAESWPTTVGAELQSYGITIPELPAG